MNLNFVTYDDLVKCDACKEGLAFFEMRYPHGGRLIDILKDPIVPKQFITWGEGHYLLTPEEDAARISALAIDESSEVYKSYDVMQSSNIHSSKHIYNSFDVIDSADISASSHISYSSSVDSSINITLSHNIKDSKNIRSCKFVIESDNVFWSKTIEDSKNVIFSTSIYDSFCISTSKSLENCYFCEGLNNVSNAIFCNSLYTSEAEYACFNAPISKRQFDSIKKRLQELYSGWKPMPVEGVGARSQYSAETLYSDITKDFVDYAATLPCYDPIIFKDIIKIEI